MFNVFHVEDFNLSLPSTFSSLFLISYSIHSSRKNSITSIHFKVSLTFCFFSLTFFLLHFANFFLQFFFLRIRFSPRTFIPAVGTGPYTAGNGVLNDRKRWFTALIFTLFHRNPSVRITTAVSGRFSPIYSRFWPFTRRSVGSGVFLMTECTHANKVYSTRIKKMCTLFYTLRKNTECTAYTLVLTFTLYF
jgi:hypothetical protein